MPLITCVNNFADEMSSGWVSSTNSAVSAVFNQNNSQISKHIVTWCRDVKKCLQFLSPSMKHEIFM